jgi:hypothetical protein
MTAWRWPMARARRWRRSATRSRSSPPRFEEAARNGRDQAANIDSLTRAIGEVDGHSQANAQAAESNAEAAARVVATARDLDGLISAFRMQAAERAA